MIEGLKGIDDLIHKLRLRNAFLESKNGTKYDAKNNGGLVRGPLLHQDSRLATEEESAAFEAAHPEVIQHLLYLKNEVEKLLE